MITATGVRHLALRLTIPAAGLAATIALALLYHLAPQYYYGVLVFFGFEPFRYPFLDLQNVLSWVDCWQHGIDVFVNNPCDVLGRVLDYPPLWLRFTFLPGKEWTNLLGLCLAISFFLALAVLPTPRSRKELLLRLIATLSPTVTYAVERGNIDLLVFDIATAVGFLLLGSLGRRIAAYALIVIAGLLKIYPLILMVLTLRERPRVFLWVNGAAALVVLSTGVYFYADLLQMVSHIKYVTFSDSFGAHYIPDITAKIVDRAAHPGLAVLRLVRLAMFMALFLAMTGWFFRLVRWRDFCIALERIPELDKIFLLMGAALISGCFFAGPNIGYRGIHLLFGLPGLLAMARMPDDMRVRKAAVAGSVLIVALMWAGFFTWEGLFPQILSSWIGEAPGEAVVRFLRLLSQVAWWQVVTLFIATLIGSCANWLEGVLLLPNKLIDQGRREPTGKKTEQYSG